MKKMSKEKEKHVYCLPIDSVDENHTQLTDDQFYSSTKRYTIEEFIEILNFDLISIDIYWFRVL